MFCSPQRCQGRTAPCTTASCVHLPPGRRRTYFLPGEPLLHAHPPAWPLAWHDGTHRSVPAVALVSAAILHSRQRRSTSLCLHEHAAAVQARGGASDVSGTANGACSRARCTAPVRSVAGLRAAPAVVCCAKLSRQLQPCVVLGGASAMPHRSGARRGNADAAAVLWECPWLQFGLVACHPGFPAVLPLTPGSAVSVESSTCVFNVFTIPPRNEELAGARPRLPSSRSWYPRRPPDHGTNRPPDHGTSCGAPHAAAGPVLLSSARAHAGAQASEPSWAMRGPAHGGRGGFARRAAPARAAAGGGGEQRRGRRRAASGRHRHQP